MARFSELARRQRVMEIGGLPALNDSRKLIPVKWNKTVPSGDPIILYDFEGMKAVRRNGKIEFDVDQNHTIAVRGNLGDAQESPYGLLLVPPTPNNIAKLARSAEAAEKATREAIKSNNGGEEFKEVRKCVPVFERMDVEDEETMQAAMSSVLGNPELIKSMMSQVLADPELRKDLKEMLKKD